VGARGDMSSRVGGTRGTRDEDWGFYESGLRPEAGLSHNGSVGGTRLPDGHLTGESQRAGSDFGQVVVQNHGTLQRGCEDVHPKAE